MIQDKFACVVLNYNDAETTTSIVDKICGYTLIGHIVIVDNCSTDDSIKKLFPLQNEKISLVQAPKNGGYGAGNNYGIRYAVKQLGYRYVLISNPDVNFEDNVLKDMLSTFQQDETCAIVAPVQLNRNGKVITDYAWQVPSIFQYILTSGLILGKIFRAHRFPRYYTNENLRLVVDCVQGAFLALDTSKFDDSYYDEEFFLYCEELVIGKQIKDKGYHTILLTGERYEHLHSVSIDKSISSIRKQRKLLTHSKLLFMKKYLNANWVQLRIAHLFFCISDIEACVNEKRKKLIEK